MAGPVFTNNATGALAAAYSDAATDLTLVSGQGALFPSPGAEEWFPVTIVDATNQIEIVYCTSRTADTLTVTRGQEGTPARALGLGERVEHRLTAGALAALRDREVVAGQIADGAITTSKLAADAVTSDKIAFQTIQTNDLAPASVTAGKLAFGAAESNLGFTPVQQGGGAGQLGSKIYFGFSPPKLRVQVDATDFGFVLTEQDNGDPSGAGYRGFPPVDTSVTADHTFALSDIGKAVIHTGGDHVFYVPTSAALPAQYGCRIKVNNIGGSVILAGWAGVTLVWVPGGATGNRTLAAPASVFLEKQTGDTWWVYGFGLT